MAESVAPEVVFSHGDSVPLTVAVSGDDFEDLAGDHARDTTRLHPLLPALRKHGGSRSQDVLAVQVTVFPRAGICIGTTLHHAVADGSSYAHFLRTWAAIHRLGPECKKALEMDVPPLLDRGVVFAVAHVRGGGELGRSWYEDGKTLTKKNTFTDFVAVADHLIAEGRTTPELMVAEGGSAGGLLMGAVANVAPDRFAGIVAAVPFVDALTSILDPDLPLTVIEWDEWGDPLHDAEVYEYMRGYSPYENVRDDVTYPRILAVTSINDTRVLYVEPAKWVARLREVGAPVLLKTEMSAGHGGVSGRYESWRERAFEIAWMLDVLGRA